MMLVTTDSPILSLRNRTQKEVETDNAVLAPVQSTIIAEPLQMHFKYQAEEQTISESLSELKCWDPIPGVGFMQQKGILRVLLDLTGHKNEFLALQYSRFFLPDVGQDKIGPRAQWCLEIKEKKFLKSRMFLVYSRWHCGEVCQDPSLVGIYTSERGFLYWKILFF